jgi:hypothetical protein
MAKGNGVRAVCGALMAAMSVALGISGSAADDLGSEEIGTSDAGSAASMATDGGRRLWSRQPGTSSDDQAYSVATDTDGNVYVVGGTGGALGGANEGAFDAWVIKFDGGGRRLWSRQFGTNTTDSATGVATDKNGDVYLVGYTFGALGGPNKGLSDAWVSKLDGDGHQLWIRQFGTSADDFVRSVATDQDGNLYVVGYTEGALGGFHKGEHDAWVVKFDDDGHELWKRQPGTSASDLAIDVATDTDGNVFLVGYTFGALGGPYKGDADAWVIKFDSAGHGLWRRQPGTSAEERALHVAPDRDGVYVVGFTLGTLGGPNMGGEDGWVIKYAR